MRGNAFRHWLPAAFVWAIAWTAAAPTPASAGGLAAIDAYQVGRHHLANGQHEQALAAFNDALRMNPQFVQAYVARGKLLAEMGQFPSALADLNFALHLQPTHVEGFAYRAFALLSTNRPNEALADLDTALRLDPNYARVHYLRSQTLRGLGKEADAEVSLATALKLDPTIEARQIVMANHEGVAADGRIELASPTTPSAPERTSVMARNEPVEPMDKRKMGNVVRYERHPFLAKLERPAISQPRQTPSIIEDRQPQTLDRPAASFPTPTPTVTPNRPSAPAELPTPNNRESQMPAPAQADGTADLASSPLVIPQLNDLPQTTDPKKSDSKNFDAQLPDMKFPETKYPETSADHKVAAPAKTDAVTESTPALTPLPSTELPLPSTELPLLEKEPIAAPPASSVATTSPTQEPTLELPSFIEAPAPSSPSTTSAPEKIAARIEVAPVIAAPIEAAPFVAESIEPAPIEPAPIVAAPIERTPIETAAVVIADQPDDASKILADPAFAERHSSDRRAAADSERLAAALEAARQASLDRTAVVMSTQASPGGPIDMPVISDMPTEAEMAAAEQAAELAANAVEIAPSSVPVAMPIVGENALAMVSDTPSAGVAELVAPPSAEADARSAALAEAQAEAQLEAEARVALREFDETIRQNPADVSARLLRGQLQLGRNNLEAAVADFDEVLKLEPAHVEARFGRAHALYLAGYYADAAYDYTAVLVIDDQHAAALIERGHCQALLGKSVDAERDRSAALALDPSLAKTGPKYGGSFAVAAANEASSAAGSDTASNNTASSNAASNDTANPNGVAPASAFGNLFNPAAAGEQNAAPKPESNAIFVSDADRPMKSEVVPAYAGDEITPQAEIMSTSAELLHTPGNAMLYVRRAQAWMAVGRHLDAVDDLTAALHIDAECNVALNLRSKAYAALGQTTEAQADQARADQLSIPR